MRNLPLIENLETRQLMSLTVSSIIADNRGQVYVNLNPGGDTVNRTTISKSSVLLYSAGKDGAFGTLDDVRLTENVVYNVNVNRIIVTTKIAPSVGYRVRLIASRIFTQGGQMLDGEFHGTYPTGNGSQGGDFNGLVKIDKTNTPTIRMTTSLGSLALKLDGIHAPVTTNYYIGRCNTGFYDNVMFNQSTSGAGSILESGFIKVGADDSFFVTSPGAAGKVPETTGLVDNQATIAMSREPFNNAIEGNGFFFNMTNNPNKKNSVFGSVVSGFNVLQAISALPAITLAPEHSFVSADTSHVPVINSSITHVNYTPFADSVQIRRTAVQMRVTPMT